MLSNIYFQFDVSFANDVVKHALPVKVIQKSPQVFNQSKWALYILKSNDMGHRNTANNTYQQMYF